jgi:hypothetical protein
MASLLAQRCWNHAAREAVARCPECGKFFCRECVTEHEDREVCSACLKQLAAQKQARRRSFAPLGRAVAAIGGMVVASLFFFLIGRVLVNMPADFHEGTIWERTFEEIKEGAP